MLRIGSLQITVERRRGQVVAAVRLDRVEFVVAIGAPLNVNPPGQPPKNQWVTLGTGGAVAELVGNEGGVVSGVFNLESSGVEASDLRPRHDEDAKQREPRAAKGAAHCYVVVGALRAKRQCDTRERLNFALPARLNNRLQVRIG